MAAMRFNLLAALARQGYQVDFQVKERIHTIAQERFSQQHEDFKQSGMTPEQYQTKLDYEAQQEQLTPGGRIADVLASVLASYTIEDVSVEDPPLEEVIAEMFARSAENQTEPVGAGVASLENNNPARS